jgi:Fe-S cluster assembly protein SufD
MSVETKLVVNKQFIEELSNQHNEPTWLKNTRLQALDLIEGLELPKPDKSRIGKWNFTEFKVNANNEIAKSIDEHERAKGLLDDSDSDQNFIFQQNGETAFSQVSQTIQDQGVIFTDMKTAVEKHSDLIEKYFMKKIVNVNENKLLALHAALVNGGVFIYVPKNIEVKIPLQAVYSLEGKNGGLFNHVIIVAEANSSITYVENNISGENVDDGIANLVAEVYAEAGARVSFGAVDNLGEGVTTYVVRRAHVGKDAKVEWALGQMNDGNTVSENTTELIGDGSYATTKTVSVGRGTQKQNFTTNMVHHGKYSEGYILTHGVMRGEATSIFNGITKIIHGASKSNGEQTERVLMLSEKSRGDANPILLIDEDDVTAGHAASVGRIDPLQMFYLMSRGISRKEAERLIIHGFLAPVVNLLPIESVRKRLTEVIERKVN